MNNPTSTRERIARLEDALKPFAEAAVHIPSDQEDFKLVAHVPAGPHAAAFAKMRDRMTAGDFRRAREALLSGAPFVEEKGLGADVAVSRSTPGQGVTREGLQELRALSEAATEGPWTLDGLGRYMVAQDRFGISVYSYHYPEPTSANAAFIVAAVNFVRALSSGSEATTASLDSGGTSLKGDPTTAMRPRIEPVSDDECAAYMAVNKDAVDRLRPLPDDDEAWTELQRYQHGFANGQIYGARQVLGLTHDRWLEWLRRQK